MDEIIKAVLAGASDQEILEMLERLGECGEGDSGSGRSLGLGARVKVKGRRSGLGLGFTAGA